MDENTRAGLIRVLRRDALLTGRVFPLSNGGDSPYYLDARKVTLEAEGSYMVATAICQELRAVEFNAIGGMSLGADPIVGAVLAHSYLQRVTPLRGFLVRKEHKRHGLRQQVEGPILPGDHVVVVDDVTTTGKSAMDVVDLVRGIGCHVVRVISLVDRLEGAQQFFADQGIVFRPLLSIQDLGVLPTGKAG